MARRGFPVSILHEQKARNCFIPGSRITVLKGHTLDVFNCTFNSQCDILATASADATARLWDLSRRRRPTDSSDHTLTHYVDNHGNETLRKEDILALEWSRDGKFLATGSGHGYARLWDTNGQLQKTLYKHEDAILAVKWSKDGNRILTASSDQKVIMWHVNTGIITQMFEFHTGSVIDVDWHTDSSFASASKDNKVLVCELDRFEPTRSFIGHSDDVCTVQWNPQGSLLASGSEDQIVKLWSMDVAECVQNLTGHTNGVGQVRWSPTGSKTNHPNAPLRLASASRDQTVRLWDVERGICTRVLGQHTRNVFDIAFSPDGLFIASGSTDRTVKIWSVASGDLLRSYKHSTIIYDVCWNSAGTILAACAADGSAIVFDIRSYS